MKFLKLAEAKSMSKEQLGGKGFGLVEMTNLGIAVPPAVIIPTEVCVAYMKSPAAVVEWVRASAPKILEALAEDVGYAPLVSVRSGARVSMPGMMDTILNVGMDKNTWDFWSKKLGQKCAEDCRKRLITMFGNVVHGIDRHELEAASNPLDVFKKHTGAESFPTVIEQLEQSILAVFNSWNNERAVYYRDMNKIPHEWGTACVIQAMVFGNFNDKSCTGVMFTRNVSDGTKEIVGEYAVNAQGEDVVAGIVTPTDISQMHKWDKTVQDELYNVAEKLEHHFGDVQDLEFTVQDGKVYLLQTRNAKRNPRAAVKIALDLINEGVLKFDDVKKVLSAEQFYLSNVASVGKCDNPNWTGIPACAGVVTGKPVFSSADAVASKVPCILVTKETTPDDIKGMDKAIGILTMTGGHTSHAAVVARGMNKPCVVGLSVDFEQIKSELGSEISIDGATGRVWNSKIEIVGGDNPDRKMLEKMLVAKAVSAGKEVLDYTVFDVSMTPGAKPPVGMKPLVSRPFSLCENDFLSMIQTKIPQLLAPNNITTLPKLVKEMLGDF